MAAAAERQKALQGEERGLSGRQSLEQIAKAQRFGAEGAWRPVQADSAQAVREQQMLGCLIGDKRRDMAHAAHIELIAGSCVAAAFDPEHKRMHVRSP